MASTCDEYFSLSVSCVYMQEKQTVNTEVVLEPESLKGLSQYIKEEGAWYTAPIKVAGTLTTGLLMSYIVLMCIYQKCHLCKWQCPAMLRKTPDDFKATQGDSYSCFLLRRL